LFLLKIMSIESSGEMYREGVNLAKLTHGVDVIFGVEPLAVDAYLDRFADFDVKALRELTRKSLLSVLIDVDDCIAPPYGTILPENIEHIDRLRSGGVGVAVYSNCKAMDRLSSLRGMGVQIYAGSIAKPSAEGFRDACSSAGFDPTCTWMIGDNPLTDGGASGVLEGMVFVKPIGGFGPNLSLAKKGRLLFANCLRGIAMGSVLCGNDQVWRSHDVLARAKH
jgi:predicted HAD superfamily phosphohydrolase YqeG